MPRPLLLSPDRLFPSDPAQRDIARRLYAEVADLPIISPHGHTDPAEVATLRGMLALRLEAQGNTDAAIAEYETILAGGAVNPLAANNLISLLVWTRDDADSLAKASGFSTYFSR